MAAVGSLGGIVFSVSPKQVKTFDRIQWNSSARYAAHNRHLKKALAEKTGTDADTITFTMTLSAYLGTNPEVDMKRLHGMLNTGEVLQLMVGRNVTGIARARWVIQRLQRSLDRFDKHGNTLACKVNITLLEYARR
jgi:phage protein U